jgi:RNA polymerase sigma-70 factor (ECF subfamily)
LENAEARASIRAAVASLPEEWRSIVILAYYQGLTLKETAEALNLPLGTVKSRLHRALLMLHDQIPGGVADVA